MSFAFFHKIWLKSFTAKLKHRFQIKKLKNVKKDYKSIRLRDYKFFLKTKRRKAFDSDGVM